MNRMRILSRLLLATATVAGCSDRNTTAPSADAVAISPASFIGDRPYTWSVQCSGDKPTSFGFSPFASHAAWSWTSAGTGIDGTAVTAGCYAGTTVSGSGTRPASADGLSACVNATCKTWTFDPAGPFKAQLKGSFTYDAPLSGKVRVAATLSIDS